MEVENELCESYLDGEIGQRKDLSLSVRVGFMTHMT